MHIFKKHTRRHLFLSIASQLNRFSASWYLKVPTSFETKSVSSWKHRLTAQNWRPIIIQYSNIQTQTLLQSSFWKLVPTKRTKTFRQTLLRRPVPNLHPLLSPLPPAAALWTTCPSCSTFPKRFVVLHFTVKDLQIMFLSQTSRTSMRAVPNNPPPTHPPPPSRPSWFKI